MPKTHPAFQVFGSGEFFHPRLDGSHLNNGFNFKYDKSIKYKDLTLLASRLLLENTTTMTPMSPTKKERFRKVHQGLYNFLRGYEVRKATKVAPPSSPSLSIKKQAPKPVAKPVVKRPLVKATVQKQVSKRPTRKPIAQKPTTKSAHKISTLKGRPTKRVVPLNKKSTPVQSKKVQKESQPKLRVRQFVKKKL